MRAEPLVVIGSCVDKCLDLAHLSGRSNRWSLRNTDLLKRTEGDVVGMNSGRFGGSVCLRGVYRFVFLKTCAFRLLSGFEDISGQIGCGLFSQPIFPATRCRI